MQYNARIVAISPVPSTKTEVLQDEITAMFSLGLKDDLEKGLFAKRTSEDSIRKVSNNVSPVAFNVGPTLFLLSFIVGPEES